MGYALGVDIGGTKIASVIIDRNYKVIHRLEVESITTNKEKMFHQVVLSIDRVMEEANIKLEDIVGMGIGVPGKVDRKNGIAVYQNNLPWGNFPIRERLRNYYDFTNILIDNDVHLATLAEWEMCNLNSKETFVYTTISTGVSCATIYNGEFLRGVGFAGELGLLPVETSFTESGIGRLEQVSSGQAIAKEAKKLYGDKKILTRDVFEKYYAKDPTAKYIIQSVSKSIAHGLYSIICVLDPKKIVLGGGVINKNPILLDLIKDHLLHYVSKEQEQSISRIAISHYKESSGIIGAGVLGLNL